LAACALAFPLAALCASQAERERLEDFDAMWRAIDRGYAFFDAGRSPWQRARANWRSRDDFIATLRGALDELHDDHVTLAAGDAPAARVPYDIDIWPRWTAGAARVEAVRVFSDADVAGVRPGQRLTEIGDVGVERAVRERLQRPPKDAAEAEWALRRVLAERNHRGATRTSPAGAITARRIGEERDLGYIRLRIGIAEPRFDEQLERAFEQVRDTRALILDLRDNAGPGSRALTRAVLAHFVEREKPWQLHAAPGAKRVPDLVAPRGSVYAAPVVVLVDRWTAGEGEALAAGLAAVARARLIGTRTAGLGGEPRDVRLPVSGIVVTFPAERTFHVDGKPRRALAPDIEIDLGAPQGGPGDPILYQALKRLERRASPAPAGRSAPR
jgi:carboxyl-terminal processing protease